MSGTAAPVPTPAPVPAPSPTGVTFHVGRTEDVPLAFALAGASVPAVAGGTLTVADPSIATATLSAGDSMAKFVGVKVGSTTATYANTSGGDPLNATITLTIVADPAADGVTFSAASATEEPVAPVAAPVAPVATPTTPAA